MFPIGNILWFVLALAALPAAAADQARPQLHSIVTVQVATLVPNSPAKRILGREEIDPIVAELNTLRKKRWNQGDVKFWCYAVVVLEDSSGRRAGLYRLGRGYLVERPLQKGDSAFNLKLDQQKELPALSRQIAALPVAEKCRARQVPKK